MCVCDLLVQVENGAVAIASGIGGAAGVVAGPIGMAVGAAAAGAFMKGWTALGKKIFS